MAFYQKTEKLPPDGLYILYWFNEKDKYCMILFRHELNTWETISFLVYSIYTHCIILEKFN